MKKRFEELLARMGLKREAGIRCFPLDADHYTAVVVQAKRKQMPAEEMLFGKGEKPISTKDH